MIDAPSLGRQMASNSSTQDRISSIERNCRTITPERSAASAA
jgi:hypothetical protein